MLHEQLNQPDLANQPITLWVSNSSLLLSVFISVHYKCKPPPPHHFNFIMSSESPYHHIQIFSCSLQRITTSRSCTKDCFPSPLEPYVIIIKKNISHPLSEHGYKNIIQSLGMKFPLTCQTWNI